MLSIPEVSLASPSSQFDIAVTFSNTLGGNPYFILPVVFLSICYITFEFIFGGRKPQDFGFCIDNLRVASFTTFLAFVFPVSTLIVYGLWKDVSLPSHFYYTLLLYPLWGILQQLFFQGFFLENLTRLGSGQSSLPIKPNIIFYGYISDPYAYVGRSGKCAYAKASGVPPALPCCLYQSVVPTQETGKISGAQSP